MGTETLTLRAINRATLARQMLLAREPVSTVDAIESLLGLQAQEPKPPFTALWSRLAGFEREALRSALQAREVVRATLMRGTLHLMTGRDYAAFRAPLQPVLDQGFRMLGDRAEGLDTEAVLPVAEALLQAEPRTFNELRALLLAEFPDVNERALGFAVRMLVPLVMVPTSDPLGFPSVARFTLAEPWLGTPLSDAPEPGPLVRRYLAAFGPATAADVQTWSGLQGIAAVIAELRPGLRVFRDERGRELFDIPDAPRPGEDVEAPPRFLPEFDSLVLAHADRTRIVADRRRRRQVERIDEAQLVGEDRECRDPDEPQVANAEAKRPFACIRERPEQQHRSAVPDRGVGERVEAVGDHVPRCDSRVESPKENGAEEHQVDRLHTAQRKPKTIRLRPSWPSQTATTSTPSSGLPPPHFAYQLRARLKELVAGLPASHEVRRYAEERMERWIGSGTPRRRPTKGRVSRPPGSAGNRSRRQRPPTTRCRPSSVNVFVTGGSRGIGRAIALRFARDGAKRVAIGYLRNDRAAEETAEELRAAGAEPVLVRGNITSQRVLDEVAALGPLDVLVHNAATGVIRPALETEDKHWDWTLNANARALLQLRAWPRRRCRTGRRSSGSRRSARSACSKLHAGRHVEGRARVARPLPRRRACAAGSGSTRCRAASSRPARWSTSPTARRCSRSAARTRSAGSSSRRHRRRGRVPLLARRGHDSRPDARRRRRLLAAGLRPQQRWRSRSAGTGDATVSAAT